VTCRRVEEVCQLLRNGIGEYRAEVRDLGEQR
jgi:hypothetical protein